MSDIFYQEATNAYIVSYNAAMERMHNPSAAGQVAAAVTMSYMMLFKEEQNQQKQGIEMNILGALAAAAMVQQVSQDDGEDSEKK